MNIFIGVVVVIVVVVLGFLAYNGIKDTKIKTIGTGPEDIQDRLDILMHQLNSNNHKVVK